MLIDGKKIAEKIKVEIQELLKDSGPKTLAIIYVGQNPVIESYVNLKKRVGEELGIGVSVFKFGELATESEILQAIKESSEKFSGIIVQLPLPESLDRTKILNSVPKNLDVDVLSESAFQDFKDGLTAKLPPVVSAVARIFKEMDIHLTDKKIAIVGHGALVGRPMEAYLKREGFSPDVVDEAEENTAEILKNADIIITGVGQPNLIKPQMIKDDVVLIDAGTSTADGKIAGDIDRDSYGKASLVSPVPGGVGPITVVSLFKNLFLN